MDTGYLLDRRTAVPQIVGDHRDFLFVTGLGGTSRDISHLTGDGASLYALGGAMGAALSVGLGLALARPDRRVMVVTGDGELLMGVGTLATIAVMDPPNLSVLCVDNGHYLETGGQLTHTARGTDLEAMARGAGFKATATVDGEAQIDHGRAVLREPAHCSFVLLRVAPTEPPAFRRDMDAAATRLRMKASLA
ncbi:MAG: thiamine pyrophosphate-dependent enzyme [Thalassobaculum sp.]|uniref:thiamine pyrophosphate-dependent enzyme n=1 Tax=Thalassobaculum sp. TaxID=2022740 RepID=UPI0032EFF3FB